MIWLSLLVAVTMQCPVAGWLDQLVGAHRSRYPSMENADVAKLLNQATQGSEHAVADSAAADAWMRAEWARMGDGQAEPLVDTLGIGGRFARVHLRPWRAAGGSPERLTAAFIATARLAGADTAAACRRYPPTRHSAGYEMRYRPAYRVVAVELIPDLLRGLR